MPSIQFNILNQLQTPAFYASSLATRPAFGFLGRIFIDTDSPSTGMYRDTGAAWIKVAGTGTTTGSGTNGQVSFWNGASSLSGSNNLFWDNTNSYLGIGVTTPGSYLDIHGTLNQLIQLNNTTTANSNIAYQNQSVTKWRVGNFYNAGANDFTIFDATNSVNRLNITSAGTTSVLSRLNVNGATDNSLYQLNVTGTGRFSGNLSVIGTTQLLDNVVVQNINGGTLNSAMSINNSTNGDARLLLSNTVNGALISYSSTGTQRFSILGGAGTEIFTVNTNTLAGLVTITNTPVYSTNALALAGGLVAGNVYRNSLGVLSIVF
jgi:hypothetical protein